MAQIHFGQSDSACARLVVSGMGDNGKDSTLFSDAVKRDADDPLIAVARSLQTGRDVNFQAWGYASCADTLTKPIETSRVAAASFGQTKGRVYLELSRADAGSGGGMGGGGGASGGGAAAGGGTAMSGGGSAGGGGASGGGLGGGTGGGLGLDDGGLDDAGTLPDGGCVACADGTCRAGVCFLTFPFVTSTFDGMTGLRKSRVAERVELGCGDSGFDSTTLTFSGWCGQPQPTPVEVTRPGKETVILLPMRGFGLDAGSTLTLSGNRPVALVVFGDAVVSGHLSASASRSTPGAGSPALDCASSASEGGSPTVASLGAGGGGFVTAGGKGGGILNGATAGAVGGAPFTGGVALRGGCPGGHVLGAGADQAGAG
ncbi:MAG: hypothetical protein K1X89_31170, partial [Myxococcaceae bacterium]|nr:hypothetical protein [Myxococcaceae bacterium]